MIRAGSLRGEWGYISADIYTPFKGNVITDPGLKTGIDNVVCE